MKAYLITTACLFGLMGGLHVWRTIAEWSRLRSDPHFIVQGPVLGLVAVGLAIWALKLLLRTTTARG